MWTDSLAEWYAPHGRHHLPWRATRDPWAVLVSEVMLQQTQVSRVVPRWEAFLERWPGPDAFAATPLADVLRWWQGLGYPRRALALHRCAAHIAAQGWPDDEAGIRALPGIGPYTARALLTLAFEHPSAPPIDVNIGRVAARAGVGAELGEMPPAALAAVVEHARPAEMPPRDYVLALFDVGALHCRANPRCDTCPLATGCAFTRMPTRVPGPRARRQGPYAGSFRAARGRVLTAMLAEPAPAHMRQLVEQVGGLDEETARRALQSLVADGLVRVEPGWDARL